MSKRIYETLWRNKWLCSEATDLASFIACLKDAVASLESMAVAGIELDLKRSSLNDDYAMLTTSDPEVAKQFGLLKGWQEE
jgi:hypothetical protein